MMESDNIPANQWTHMFITYNGSVGKLYRNGTQVATDSPIGEFYDWSETVYIGAATASPDTGTWTDYFNGSIDEVRIYNRALSADEILAIYNSTAPYYISNHSLPRTDSNGNYNYTYTTPSTAGNYEVKVNTTYNSMHAEATATLTVNANDSCTCPGVGTSWIIDMSHSCNITSDCDITTGYLNFTSTGYVRFNATINCTGMQKPSADQIIYIDKNCVLKVH
jgi:hypothetical protein